MTTRRARIGIIGAGWWSTRVHLPSLASYPPAEITGIADPDANHARAAADKFGVRHVFDDHQKLLGLGLDAVIIATPHHTHHTIARDALCAGVDVLVEKPMVLRPEHAHELVELADDKGVRLHVGYPYPHTRHAQLLRKLISDGKLGDPLLVNSLFATTAGLLYGRGQRKFDAEDALVGPTADTYNDPAKGGGQAYTQATHSVSLMLYTTGLQPTEVDAQVATVESGVDLSDAATFGTREGAIGVLASTGAVPSTQRPVEQLRVFGSGGHAMLDTSNGTLSVHFSDGSRHIEAPLADEERYPEGQTSRHLVDCVLGHEPVIADGQLGLATVEFLDALLRAAHAGSRQVISQHKTEDRR
jgi:predicted dehydrogenase